MKIILLGDGGHSRVIQEMVYSKKGYEIAAVLDDKYKQGFQLNGKIHAPISFIWRLLCNETKIVMAIGNNRVRKEIVKELDLPLEYFISIVHPTAVISTTSKIGRGTVIMPYAVVNAKADIGIHCIINTAAIIEHDNKIGDYAHISPNATLTGNVSVDEGVHIGSSETVIPVKIIGK